MYVEGIPIPYLNASLISVAKRCGTYFDGGTSINSNSYGLIKYARKQEFIDIVNNLDITTVAIGQGADNYAVSNYTELFGRACYVISISTHIDPKGIAEIVKADAKTTFDKDREKSIRELESKKNRDRFLSQVDLKMSKLVRELRITIAKSYKPIVAIGAIIGVGCLSWVVTQYLHKEYSAQKQLADFRSQNLILRTENKELSKYKDVKFKIQQLSKEVDLLKKENNSFKDKNKKLEQEISSLTNNNRNLQNRIEKCNSGFLRLRKC